uniref:Uncharacterized protein n=1 Tax=Haptolina ericina TaxID=156174 RepID=A0A7S3ER97_9EUKA|mmetsp:Transcript_1591/g.3462  ORF Transcript_1591/g.3462 Transcript_1591/m.3462 type:complete len:104 (+) Transcript_1591:298-609(+)
MLDTHGGVPNVACIRVPRRAALGASASRRMHMLMQTKVCSIRTMTLDTARVGGRAGGVPSCGVRRVRGDPRLTHPAAYTHIVWCVAAGGLCTIGALSMAGLCI